MKGIVLLSGGLDSSVLPSIAKNECEEVVCLFTDYDQRTVEIEKQNSKKLAEHYGLEFFVKKLPLGGGTTIDKNYGKEGISDKKGVSTGYVPMRNLIMISLAGNVAENLWKMNNKISIYYGAQAGDEEGYPDCRKPFVHAVSLSLNESTERNSIELKAPLIDWPDERVLKEAVKIGVPLKYTFSCYNDIEGKACGECAACIERKKAFKEADFEDPIEYAR